LKKNSKKNSYRLVAFSLSAASTAEGRGGRGLAREHSQMAGGALPTGTDDLERTAGGGREGGRKGCCFALS
jgi:hypothetical protein